MTHDDELRRNAILGALPEDEFSPLSGDLDVLDVGTRTQVYQPGEVIRDVYFPLSAVFSVVAMADERIVVEVATIGREGLTGLPVFLGAATTPQASFCQIEGRAARCSAESLRKALSGDGALQAVLSRYTQATMVQIAQNVVCNGAHPAVQRAARWLLTTRDRVGGEEFMLTQEFLAQMLGVRRQTASDVARELQADGLIRYVRGRVTIADACGLERVACQCYDIIKAEFDQITSA